MLGSTCLGVAQVTLKMPYCAELFSLACDLSFFFSWDAVNWFGNLDVEGIERGTPVT